VLSDGLTNIGAGAARLWINGNLTPDEFQVVRDAKVKSGRKQFRLGRCFWNAQMLTLMDSRLVYVEGVAGRRGTPHAWNAINGKVVDETWKRVLPSTTYFGHAFDQSAVAERWLTMRGMVNLAFLGAVELSALLKALEARDETLVPA
jgi:hypothetical protein